MGVLSKDVDLLATLGLRKVQFPGLENKMTKKIKPLPKYPWLMTWSRVEPEFCWDEKKLHFQLRSSQLKIGLFPLSKVSQLWGMQRDFSDELPDSHGVRSLSQFQEITGTLWWFLTYSNNDLRRGFQWFSEVSSKAEPGEHLDVFSVGTKMGQDAAHGCLLHSSSKITGGTLVGDSGSSLDFLHCLMNMIFAVFLSGICLQNE